MTIFLWIVAVLCVFAGIAGTVLPALPGVPLVFLGLLIGAWIDNFARVGGVTLTIFAVATILAFLTDFISAAYGAKRVNASREALVGATLGAVFGIFGGLFGLILGPFLGAAIGEFIAQTNKNKESGAGTLSPEAALAKAGEVGLATWMGMILGTAVKLTLCFVMVGIFITAYFWK